MTNSLPPTSEGFNDHHPFDLYSTGCFLSPVQMKLANEEWKWVWVVNCFDSDSYYQGDYIELNPIADTQNGLIQTKVLKFEEEEEDEDEDLDDEEEEDDDDEEE